MENSHSLFVLSVAFISAITLIGCTEQEDLVMSIEVEHTLHDHLISKTEW
jgi:hypothetical protein